MIWVAIVEAIAIVALAVVFAGLVRSLLRQQARERDLLLNKIMYLAGRTWEPPPAGAPAEPEPAEIYLDPSGLPESYFEQ